MSKNRARDTAVVATVLLGSFITPPFASAQTGLERVEITGSTLRRVDLETSVPVTVIRMDDLIRRGVTQVEQAMGWIASNQSSLGIANTVGSVNGGKAEADLRGLSGPFATSANKTLVLLNGRRLVNHPFDGAAVDLYALPLAAVDRIEILRDGASAIYGSDAIGGVVNVILKREYRQTAVGVDAQGAEHGGGATRRFSLATGIGSLAERDFQANAVFDVRRQNRLAAIDRPFSNTGVLKGDVFWLTSGTSFPGDIDGFEPSWPDCSPPTSLPTPDGTCRADIVREIDAIPANDQRTAMFRGDLKLSNALSMSAEYLWARHHEVSTVAAAGAQHCMRKGTASFPSPYFPAAYDARPVTELCSADSNAQVVDGGLVDWREVPAGNRKRANTTFADRALVELEGTFDSQWDFRSALGRSKSRSTERVVAGYANDELMQLGVWNGLINPFGAQSGEGQAAIDAAQVIGPVQSGRSRSDFADLRIRGDLAALANGPLSVALGVEHRRDRSTFGIDDIVSVLPSLGLDPDGDTTGSRQVSAMYAEVAWPVTRALDLTAAARLDHYSDFGRTVNPKLGFKWRAAPDLLFRGSAGSGFRAPNLYEIYRPQAIGFTAGIYNDPVNCVDGNVAPGVNAQEVCDQTFNVRTAGPAATGNNIASLQPEKSSNLTLGFVIEAARSVSFGVDFWHISVRNLIGGLPEQAVFDDPVKYGGRIVRCSQLGVGGAPSIGRDQFSACQNRAIDAIAYIDLPTENLGRLNTSGVDLSASWRALANEWGRLNVGLDGTYVRSYRYQRESNGTYNDAVGRYADNAPIFRWQHALSVNWIADAWSLTLVQRYKSGYVDQEPSNRVASYALHDALVQWGGIRNLTLSIGIRNLFDRDPPQSLQFTTFQAGYDPRFTDPSGRVLALRAGYRF